MNNRCASKFSQLCCFLSWERQLTRTVLSTCRDDVHRLVLCLLDPAASELMQLDVYRSPNPTMRSIVCTRRPALVTSITRILSKLHFHWTNLLTGSRSLCLYCDVQITALLQHPQFFTGQMPFLSLIQQCQSTLLLTYLHLVLENQRMKIFWYQLT